MTRLERIALWVGLGLGLLFGLFLGTADAQNVTLTGILQSANGLPAQNYVITFTPTQWFFVAGTGVVVNNPTNCATSIDGSTVQLQNPLTAPVVTPGFAGTLPAGNYYVEVTWLASTGHETLPSPEAIANLSSTGNLTIPAPGAAPQGATKMEIYIGATSGSETLQGNVVAGNTYVQSVPLVTGVAPPATNTTVCSQVANDAGWPTGTGYQVAVTDPNGNVLPGYPMTWQLLGPNTTINLSNGLPYYHGIVTYPVPILASPLNHAPQSISGPLSLTGYNLVNVGEIGVGTGLPAYGLDIRNTGPSGAVNAGTGYLIGGLGPLNHVLLGNGTYYVDSATLPYSILTGAPTLFYQTLDLNGTAQTQRPVANFSSRFALTDSASPAQTNIDLGLSGVSAGTYGVPQSIGVDLYGRVTSITGTATAADYYFKVTGCAINNSGNLNACSGTVTFTSGGNTTPFFPAMPDTTYEIFCTVDTGTTSSASFSVTGSTASGNTPAFTRTTSTFGYVWTEVMALGASGSAAPIIDCHLHHN